LTQKYCRYQGLIVSLSGLIQNILIEATYLWRREGLHGTSQSCRDGTAPPLNFGDGDHGDRDEEEKSESHSRRLSRFFE